MVVQYYIDEKGRKLSSQFVVSSWRPIAALDGAALSRYLVWTAGLVLVQHTSDRMQISLNFNAISEMALAAMAYELADHAEDTALPVFIMKDNTTVLRIGNGHEALKYVMAQWKSVIREPRRPFRRRPVPLFGVTRAAFRQLVMMCTTDRVMDLTLIRRLLHRAFRDRYLVVQLDNEHGHLKLIEAGCGYPRLDEAWRRRNVGAKFAEFGDEGYSTFVQQAYREAWDTRQPVLEEIEASLAIGPPPPTILTYERLLVPVRLASGYGLLSATLIKD